MGFWDAMGDLAKIALEEARYQQIIREWMENRHTDIRVRIQIDLRLFKDTNDLNNMDRAMKQAVREAEYDAQKVRDGSSKENLHRLRTIHKIFIEEVENDRDRW